MFQKLRFKLTLINVAIIFTLFLLLTAGAYYRAQTEIDRRTQHMAYKIASDIKSGLITDLPLRSGPPPPNVPPPIDSPPPNVPPPSFFFVKTDPNGSVTAQSSGHTLQPASLAALVQQILQTESSQGMTVYQKTSYFFLKTPLEDAAGFVIVFQDLEQRTDILFRILTSLILVGLGCLVLSFFGSLFMANRAMIPIQTAWQQQKDFLADVSHELRTPLAVIQTNLDIVLANPQETVNSHIKWLNNIQEETLLMIKLVDSLLFLARADSHQQILDQKPFALDAAVSAIADSFAAVAAAKGITINVLSLDPVTVCGDITRIRQVLGILLDNAIRHSPPGGTISLRLSRSANQASLSVTDCGEGIGPEHLDKIFDRFYQVDKSRSKGGAGLGLAIAKWIVENHRGVIQVASIPRVATTFTVQLPAT